MALHSRRRPSHRSVQRTRLFEQLEDRRLLAIDAVPAVMGQPTLQSSGLLSEPVEFNGAIYYAAFSGETGRELWKTDGTGAAPRLVSDINVGSGHSSPSAIVNWNGTLFFAANDGSGQELWKSDGTRLGTTKVTELNPFGNADIRHAVVAGGYLFFSATDHSSNQSVNRQLWRTDGTAEGTLCLTSLTNVNFLGKVSGTTIEELIPVGNKVFFNATFRLSPSDDSADELFVSDGTIEGTNQLTFRTATKNTRPRQLVELNGSVLFNSAIDHNVWVSDGTSAGTHSLGTSVYFYSAPANVNGTLFFSSISGTDGLLGHELWRSDGTAGGTQLVRDIVAGYEGSRPELFTNHNGTLFFMLNAPDHSGELWTSDGTDAGTIVALNAGAGITALRDLNGALYLLTKDGTGVVTLQQSDGTAGGTVTLKTANASLPTAVLAGETYFSINTSAGPIEVWKTDGTPAGTSSVVTPKLYGRGVDVADLLNIQGQLYFKTEAFSGKKFLTSSDTIAPAPRAQLAVDSYIQTSTNFLGGGPEFTDGTTSWGLPGNLPSSSTNVNGTLYFVAGQLERRLWRTNAELTHAFPIKDIRPGSSDDVPIQLTNVGGTLFFAVDDGIHGVELWRSDGTEDGTTLVADIAPGAASSNPGDLVEINGTLHFTADDGATGRELWRSNGTQAGTERVADIASGSTGSSPQQLTNVNGTLYLQADDGLAGAEPWVVTRSGAQQVADVANGAASSSPREFTFAGGTVFFTADDGVAGRELWGTTTAGTQMIVDIAAGSLGSSPAELTEADGRLFFRADDFVHWQELWTSDGTAAGTFMVRDIGTVASGLPHDLTNVNGTLFFAATSNARGEELWRISNPGQSPHVLLSGDVIYAQDDPPVAIAPQAEVWDSDHTTFDGASLTVEVVFGGDIADQLSVLQTDGLAIDGDQLSIDGNLIATYVGGANGSPLIVSFNANATAADIELVARHVAFAATAESLSADTRQIAFSLNDGISDELGLATTNVLVRLADGPPVFTIIGDPPSVGEDQPLNSVASFVSSVSPAGVSFEVVANSNPALFVFLPEIDPSGTLRYRSVANLWGEAEISIRAIDENDVASEVQTFTIRVRPANDTPTLDLGRARPYIKNAGPATIVPDALVNDIDGNLFHGEIRVENRDYRPGDLLGIRNEGGGAGQVSIADGAIAYGGLPVGVFWTSSDNHELRVFFNTDTTREAFQAVLRNLTFETSFTSGTPSFRQLNFTIADEANASVTRSALIHVTEKPGEPFELTLRQSWSAPENDGPLPLDPNALLVDSDYSDFRGGFLSVQITQDAMKGDRLGIASTLGIGIVGSEIRYENDTIATFTGGAGATQLFIDFNNNVTIVSLQALIRSLTFDTLEDAPAPERTLKLTLMDTFGVTTESEQTIDVIAENDAPILDNSLNPALRPTNEDAVNPDSTLVSSLIAGAVTDPDAGSLWGVAITAASDAHGIWQYTLNGGNTWIGMNEPSSSEALLLPGWARVRFIPSADFHGDVVLGYRAWDQTEGTSGGTLDVSSNAGGSKSLGIAEEIATLTVTPINDAPVLDTSLGPTLVTIKEGAADPDGTLVHSLLKGAVSDPDAGARQGIAIGTTSDYHGVWEYRLHNYAQWLPVGKVSETAALLLPGWSRVRFVPKADFHGTVKLYYRAWDQTQGSPGERFDLVGNTGGTNAFSVAKEGASLTVMPVNDPPKLSLSGSIGYRHDASAITLAPFATVSDIDSANFYSGRLRVWITEGASTSNRLVIGPGFTVDANNNVLQGSTIIGKRMSSGFGTRELVITFNSKVTPSIAQQLVRAIAFKTVSGAAGKRTVLFTVSDGDGGVSNEAVKTINVS